MKWILWALAAPLLLAAGTAATAQQTEDETDPVITVIAPRTVTSPVRRKHRDEGDKATITLRIIIRYADLDLASQVGAERLMDRVEGAARDACRYLDRTYPLDRDRDCVARAVADAKPSAQAVIAAAVGAKAAM